MTAQERKIALLIALALSLPGCSMFQKKDPVTDETHVSEVLPAPPTAAPDAYKEAVKLLEEEKYERALEGFEGFVRSSPASPYSQAAFINAGRALEGLGRWTEAASRYRAVIRTTDGAPKLQAMALYRLSFCHEALAEDQQTVAVLSDVLKRAEHLPKEVSRAELPARIAAAYSRVGNFGEAVRYYQDAQSGIASLRREGGKQEAAPEWLPRTLYYMGTMPLSRVTWSNFESSLRPLAHAQVYLLQAAELGAQPWAGKASRDLIAIYRDLWRAIEMAPVPEGGDAIIARRETQLLQWDRAILVQQSLQELKARTIAGDDKPATEESKQVSEFTSELEKRIVALLDQRPVGEGLTAEAQNRRSGIRGKVVDPDGTLESRFLKKSREAKSLPGTQALPDKTDEPHIEDPNL